MAKGVVWFGKQYLRKVQRAEKRALQRTAIAMVGDIKKSMGGQRFTTAERTAARYTKAGKKRKISAGAPTHRPRSKPGEPPAVQTANLINSMTHEMEGYNIARVGTNDKYASFLEFGTSKMKWRPYLRPIMDRYTADHTLAKNLVIAMREA